MISSASQLGHDQISKLEPKTTGYVPLIQDANDVYSL